MSKDKEIQEKSNLHVSQLVELAYEIAREDFKSEPFSFQSIWSKVWKKATNFSKEKVESWIGFFYSELLLDPRFVIFNFGKWKLKEYMNFDEVKKLEKTVFNDEVDIFEEDYASLMSDKKKEVEIVPEESSSLELDEEDSESPEEEKASFDGEDDMFDSDI